MVTSYVTTPPAPHAPWPVNLYNAACPDTPVPGTRHGWVHELQRLLQVHDMDLEADGVYGPRTREALTAFEQKAGIPSTGRLGPATKRSLYRTPLSAPPDIIDADFHRGVVAAAQAAIAARIPFVWGGGHDTAFGPSVGTSEGCTDCEGVCLADTTVGLDCSGLTRWLYWQAGAGEIGQDAGDQLANPWFQRVEPSDAVPGDLVFAGTDPAAPAHVGVYIGTLDDVPAQIAAPHPGQLIRRQLVDTTRLIGYYHLGR
jgi:cell wall-associated NlpC family hydrolase